MFMPFCPLRAQRRRLQIRGPGAASSVLHDDEAPPPPDSLRRRQRGDLGDVAADGLVCLGEALEPPAGGRPLLLGGTVLLVGVMLQRQLLVGLLHRVRVGALLEVQLLPVGGRGLGPLGPPLARGPDEAVAEDEVRQLLYRPVPLLLRRGHLAGEGGAPLEEIGQAPRDLHLGLLLGLRGALRWAARGGGAPAALAVEAPAAGVAPRLLLRVVPAAPDLQVGSEVHVLVPQSGARQLRQQRHIPRHGGAGRTPGCPPPPKRAQTA
mmetsp:Transcript_75039/g.209630  ORF Transcript_75039/g.209630 Transcript_75039/m.209630 type:complete len:265 (+) Transcript_75039:3-797(+)